MSDPITRQRSPWIAVDGDDSLDALNPDAVWYRRNVRDGTLWTLVAREPVIGWHLSISFRDQRGELSRYPSWDEIIHARDELLPGDVGFVMHFPVADEYVALHRTTFHLHQHPEPPS